MAGAVWVSHQRQVVASPLEEFEQEGIGSFDAVQGLDALEEVLGAGMARAIVMSVDSVKTGKK